MVGGIHCFGKLWLGQRSVYRANCHHNSFGRKTITFTKLCRFWPKCAHTYKRAIAHTHTRNTYIPTWCTNTYMHIHTFKDAYIYACIHTHSKTHTYIHVYIHITH